MKRIIVGHDGSDAAVGAVTWAAELCDGTGADLVVATAWSPEEDPGDQETEVARRDARKRAVQGEWSAPGMRAAVPTTVRLLEGIAGDELVRLAVEEDADLVAIGVSSDHERPNHLARDLLHHLHRPVAVIPPDPPPIASRAVVVGIDGSRASSAALRWAVDAARDSGGTVTAVFAHDALADSFPHPDLDNWQYHGEAAVRAQIEEQRDDKVRIELLRPAGKPEDALPRIADELGAAAIVVGTKGRGGLGGIVAGRVPVHLVERARHPVVVVPH